MPLAHKVHRGLRAIQVLPGLLVLPVLLEQMVQMVLWGPKGPQAQNVNIVATA